MPEFGGIVTSLVPAPFQILAVLIDRRCAIGNLWPLFRDPPRALSTREQQIEHLRLVAMFGTQSEKFDPTSVSCNFSLRNTSPTGLRAKSTDKYGALRRAGSFPSLPAPTDRSRAQVVAWQRRLAPIPSHPPRVA